jgi:hypothetical protein
MGRLHEIHAIGLAHVARDAMPFTKCPAVSGCGFAPGAASLQDSPALPRQIARNNAGGALVVGIPAGEVKPFLHTRGMVSEPDVSVQAESG